MLLTFQKFVIFTLWYFYELKETESNEPTAKIWHNFKYFEQFSIKFFKMGPKKSLFSRYNIFTNWKKLNRMNLLPKFERFRVISHQIDLNGPAKTFNSKLPAVVVLRRRRRHVLLHLQRRQRRWTVSLPQSSGERTQWHRQRRQNLGKKVKIPIMQMSQRSRDIIYYYYYY